jgi:hypothetical protein
VFGHKGGRNRRVEIKAQSPEFIVLFKNNL